MKLNLNLSAIIFFSRVKKYWIEGFFWRVLFPNTNIAKKLRCIGKWLISIQFVIVSYIHPRSVIVGDIFFIVIVQESFKGHGRFGKQLCGLFSSEKSNICKSSPVVCPVKMYTSMRNGIFQFVLYFRSSLLFLIQRYHYILVSALT